MSIYFTYQFVNIRPFLHCAVPLGPALSKYMLSNIKLSQSTSKEVSRPNRENNIIPSLFGILISQSFPQTKASRVSGVIEHRESPKVLPLQLNADSDDTVLRGIARQSRAMVESMGYFSACVFHHIKISKLPPELSKFSSKYMSSSDFGSV